MRSAAMEALVAAGSIPKEDAARRPEEKALLPNLAVGGKLAKRKKENNKEIGSKEPKGRALG